MKIHLTFLLIFIVSSLNAQEFLLSESSSNKAMRKAKAEAAMYAKKDYSVKDGSDMYETILNFYKDVYLSDENDVRKYIWGMGYGKSDTEEEAYKKAYDDAIEEVPGLMNTYFQMWTMAGEGTDEEKAIVQKAISDATPHIAKACLNYKYTINVYLYKKESNNKYSLHLRTLANQSDIRELARRQIMNELKKTTDWSEEKMRELLTFEK